MIRSIKKMFKSNYLFTLGVIICLAWILLAILAPVIAPHDPIAQDLTLRLRHRRRSISSVRTTLAGISSAA